MEMIRTENITCPGCGEPWTLDMKECPSCHRPVVISTFNSVYGMSAPEANKYANTYKKVLAAEPENIEVLSSIAMCYLKLKLYDKALAAFEKAIEADFDNSETYFYAAVCLLRGKKAFLAQRSDINRILEYIEAATMIEPRGIYYYFMAYVKYDFFERKYLNTTPNYHDCLQMAMEHGVSEGDIAMVCNILGVPRPF